MCPIPQQGVSGHELNAGAFFSGATTESAWDEDYAAGIIGAPRQALAEPRGRGGKMANDLRRGRILGLSASDYI